MSMGLLAQAIEMVAAIATIAMACVAWRALDAWKDQNKHDKVFEFHKTAMHVLKCFSSDIDDVLKSHSREGVNWIPQYCADKRNFYFRDYAVATHVTRLSALLGEDKIPPVVMLFALDVSRLPALITKTLYGRMQNDNGKLLQAVNELDALFLKWNGTAETVGESLAVKLHTELDEMLKDVS